MSCFKSEKQSVICRCSSKLGFLKILQISQKKIPELESLFNNVAWLKRPATLLRRVSPQVFACEICKIFKNTFFYRTPPMATSEIKEVFNFLHFLLWLCRFSFDSRGFTNNPNFILFKWKLKRKHSPSKCSSIYFAKKIKW